MSSKIHQMKTNFLQVSDYTFSLYLNVLSPNGCQQKYHLLKCNFPSLLHPVVSADAAEFTNLKSVKLKGTNQICTSLYFNR